MKSLTVSIEELARRRQAIWCSREENPAEVLRLTRHLDDLYADRRQERAERGYGRRADIVKRARIDVELERLITS